MSENYIALLGTKGGPAIRPGSSMPASNLVHMNGQTIVLDCGLGVCRGLVDQGLPLEDISLIVISHLHSDHYLELGPLLHTAWVSGLKTPVDIYGPAGLDQYIDGFLGSMAADIELRIEDEGRPDLRNLITVHTIEPDQNDGVVFTRKELTVTALRTIHPPLIDSFAFRFETNDKSVVFSGDTAPLKALEDFACGADVLVHEAMLAAALPALFARVGNGSEKLMEHFLRAHTHAHEAAQTATKAGVRHLALTHLIPADDPDYDATDWQAAVAEHWDGTLTVGRDGVKIPL